MRCARGEIIGIFDADNVPKPDVLLRVAKYFKDPSVAAVQGTTDILNADENMLTKLISYEEAVWLRNYIHGKDLLNLFVPLTGSCQFIRRDVLEEVGGWDENCLAEDLEMAARVVERGYDVKYAPDIISWQEAPSSIASLIKQRIRWFRGYMEVAIKYGRFLKTLDMKAIDAEITLIGPYIQASFIINYILSAYVFALNVRLDPIIMNLMMLTLLLTTVTLIVTGVALVYVTRPIRLRNLLWLPFIHLYWTLQCALTFYAFLQILFRCPARWVKTVKTGSCTEESIRMIVD